MKKIISILLIFIMSLSLIGCGSNSKSAAVSESAMTEEYSMAYADSYSGLGMTNEMRAEPEEPLPAPASGSSSENMTSDAEIRPEKIIYTGNATVEATDFDSALEALKKLVSDNNGFIQSSSINGNNYNSSNSSYKKTRSADYTIRIPSDKFDSVMSSLSTIGNVPRNEVYTENISSQYYDSQARLNSYQATEKRLLELLDKAETVSDIIEIEKELTEVRYNIESVQSMIKGWDNRVSYSTISIYVKEVSEYTPAEKTGFFYDLIRAIGNGFSNLGDFVLIVVESLPVLIVLAAAIFGIVKLVLKIRRARNEKKTKKSEEKDS